MAERASRELLAGELARILWEAFRGKPITLDRRGRPNYIVTLSFARALIDLALRHGVEDPLHEIDWVSILDPEASREENLRRVEEYLAALGRRYQSPEEEAAEAVTTLEQHLAYLEQLLAQAPPEERPAIEEEIRRVREELERLRRRRPSPRPRARGERPAAPPTPPPRPAPQPPPSHRPRPVPGLEELRSRVEYWVRRQVPRVYRFDWSGYRVRVSAHRNVLEQLRRKLEEVAGCRVTRVIEARPPLVILEADCSGASPPPVPVPPDMQRWLLWEKFSAALTAAGIRPEEHREEFEKMYAETEGLPFEERQRSVEELARRIVSEARRRELEELERRLEERIAARIPAAAVIEQLQERVLRLAERLTELERSIARRLDELRDEIAAAVTASAMPEPRTVIMVDEATGRPYIAPHPEILPVLKSVFPIPHDEYYLGSPRVQVWVFGQQPLVDLIDQALRDPGRMVGGYTLAQMPWLFDFLRELRRRLEPNLREWREYMRAPPPDYRRAMEQLLSHMRLVVARVFAEAGRTPPPPGSRLYSMIYWRLWRLFDRLAYEASTGEITMEDALRLLEREVEPLARLALEGRL